jgi:hypothetical protein
MPRRLLETAAMGSGSGGSIAGGRMTVYGGATRPPRWVEAKVGYPRKKGP